MTGQQNLPEPLRGGAPARRDPAAPALRQPGGPPIHTARTLDFTDTPGRDHWWGLLGAGVRQRIAEKVGPAIEWWAYRDATETDRPFAVVFGAYGLAVSRPTVGDTGRPAQLLNVRRFAPSSVRHAIVNQRPSHRPAAGPGSGAPGPGGAASGGPLPPGLTDDVRGFLGNLPPEAQSRLQAPFLAGDQIEDSNYFYYRTAAGQLDIWCYLAGRRSVTFVSGRRTGPDDAPAHAVSWDLICRMAEVAPR